MLDQVNQANLLDIHGVCRSFPKGSGEDLLVLENVDLTIRSGEIVGLDVDVVVDLEAIRVCFRKRRRREYRDQKTTEGEHTEHGGFPVKRQHCFLVYAWAA